MHDAAFDMEEHLSRRFAKNFAKAEDDAFLNGDGANKPTGLLYADNGAEVGGAKSNREYQYTNSSLYFSFSISLHICK